MTANRLADAQSPYLLQHRDNPVHWQPWDDAAFALARAARKPVLLSIGYSSCHWCHVMAHESFEDAATAAVMNALFVNIKVDREERPDLDRLFLSALQRMGKTSGWPATVFLTPEGKPFAGGGYFPREPAFGLPAFRDVLRDIAAQYHADPSRAAASGHDVIAAITARYRRSAGGTIEPSLLDKVAHDLARQLDWLYGGFGQVAPKFLHAGGHEIVLRASRRLGDADLLEQVAASMRAICDGGCYDHLGGGFHRYCTDDQWHVPHFEKMLHDNALMVALLTKFFQATRDEVFADRVREIIGWLAREMRLPDGAYAASLDADAAGGEGAFYTWPPAELRAALGDDPAFDATYALTDGSAFDGRRVIVRKTQGDRPPVLDRLRAHRDARGLPARDDKVLADWNGLAITALAEAGLAFGRDDWIADASGTFRAVRARLGGPGTLAHSALGRAQTLGFADDYACMAQAALALFEATGDDAYVAHAKAWEAALDQRFWDEADGGYFFTEADADAYAPRQKLIDETTMPTANGTMLGVLARLGTLTGDDRYARRAEGVVRCFADRLTRGSISVATALNNAQAPTHLVQIVVTGDPDGAFAREAAACFVPDRLLLRVASGAALPDAHPAHGKQAVDGKPTAYVCVGKLCLPPVTDPAALRQTLRG